MKSDMTIRVEDSGAYIEVWERDGKLGARMNFFDGDEHRKLDELRRFATALDRAIKVLDVG